MGIRWRPGGNGGGDGTRFAPFFNGTTQEVALVDGKSPDTFTIPDTFDDPKAGVENYPTNYLKFTLSNDDLQKLGGFTSS